ncbi:TPA: hypothetical protein U2C59_001540 [Streptococcus suis]|nr:hypothetical protein A7J10_09155 [Streptococcus suis]KPA68134.1 hypothetical protein XK27_03205 [Streptococcus suis]NQN66282.1 hypothetical protein [Streptococcus suis]HEM6242625.1 hypothetical protein [Streptococcus suis]HEM6296535.1 hypothetical protein [Streptococcus suis]
MMEELQKYRKISLEFRRNSSNMLNTKYNDGLLYLVRFKEFIDKSDIIRQILEDLWIDLPKDFNEKLVSEDSNSGWSYFSIPIEESKHLKLCYDYLNKIIEDDVDLAGLSCAFLLTSSKKFNDTIREFLKKAFKPLVDYINDQLSQKIMELTGVNQVMSQITQNIENNYGTASAVGTGTISSINNVSTTDIETLKNLCSNILKDLTGLNMLSEDDKEVIIDDIETIQSQVVSDRPKKIKLKKAWSSIQSFLPKIPAGIPVTLQLIELGEKLSALFF